MIFVNDKKYACETCIKGHRSSSCQHTERALFEIKKKGRPVTQCDHCRELRKTKQVHVRCSCETKPDQASLPKQPGKKGSRLPAEAAYPNGLSPSLTGVATSPAPKPVDKCTCGDGQSCHCCVPRKKQPPSGHTPPPGHSPNNPHPHVHHQHAYAPYTRPVRHQMMYRMGPCACGTNCVCPDCAQHRQNPHSHSNAQGTSMNQPFQGHGGDPCPVRCGNCFDCAGGLTLLLDPSVQSFESEQFTTSNGSFVSSYSQSQTYLGQNGMTQANGIGAQSNGMVPQVNVSQANAMPQSNGAVQVGAPAYYPPPDVEMDEFNAAMAGLDAGIAESSPSPSACGCPPGQCTCANVHQHQGQNGHPQAQGEGNYWDRPRCGFAVSTERGGCDGMVSEVGSELGVGSDAGLGVGSDGMGVGSDAGIGSDAGSVVGGSTNLSMDFADLGFGGLELPPMQYDQRFSGEYYRDSGHFSHHRADSGQFTHHRESSQFSNHSNISLPSSIDSASVSLASLASSHGISSLASSHGIPSSHGIITPHSSPLSGRITPNRQNGRLTPHAKPTPRGYRRILPKVAAMTNHRPFRRHPRPQPSLHAVMESDVSPVGAGPGQSQVLLQGGPGPRVRGSVRAHLPIVGKYFQPGGRYEPSRFRNAQQMLQMQQMQAAMQQAGLQPGPMQEQDQYQQSPQAQSLAYSAPPSESDYDGSYSPQYADEEAFGSFAEEEEDMYNEEDGQAYEYQQQQQQQLSQPQQQQQPQPQQYGFHQAMGQYGGAEPGPAYQSAPMPVRQSTLVPQSMAVLPVQAMVGGMAYVPATQYSMERPTMPLQHSSSTATPDDTPPSPKQKVSSGLGMPHTMSLPNAANAGMSHNPRGTLDDVDIKPGVPKDGQGQGPGGKKSRWPSFSVHGHRVMVGAKVMGAAYAAR